MIVTASETESLINGINSLWEPSVSAKVGGALTIFDPQNPEESISSYYSDKVYYVGTMGFFSALNSWIYAHPVIFTIVMFIVLAILAYFVYKALKIFKRKRLGESSK